MKILFSGEHYYPNGGAYDGATVVASIEDAERCLRENRLGGDGWAHVAEVQDDALVIVAEWYSGRKGEPRERQDCTRQEQERADG